MASDGRLRQPADDARGHAPASPPTGTEPTEAPCRIVLADGHCLLCSRAVRLIRRWDRSGGFRFLPLDSPQARALLAGHTLPPDLDSVVLWEGGNLYTHDDAVFRILPHLRWPWRWLAVFRYLPRAWTHAAYRWVARHRYRFFGRSEMCRIAGELPTPDLPWLPDRPEHCTAPVVPPAHATPADRPAAPRPPEAPAPGDAPR